MGKHVWIGPHEFDARTAAMIGAAQKIVGFTLRIAQGSYRAGKTSASSGTHDGGGAVDFSLRGLSYDQEITLLKTLRRIGFAAWIRPAVPGLWGRHLHAIAVGCPDLSRSAKAQVAAYKAGRDGLRGNRPDPYAYLGIAPTTWEQYKATLAPEGHVRWSRPLGFHASGPDVTHLLGHIRPEGPTQIAEAKRKGLRPVLDNATWARILKVQANHGITENGVGPRTWRQITGHA